MMRRYAFLAAFIVALVLTAQAVYYYSGLYIPKRVEKPTFAEVGVEKAVERGFKDEFAKAEGKIIFDVAHSNAIASSDLNVLVPRLAARGYSIEFLEDSKDLEEKLKYANSLAVVAPQNAYEQKEVDLISKFISNGGRLLLIHDPTRESAMNSLSVPLGVFFEDGYLYDQVENDGNFRYIFIENFAESEITRGLKKIAMYVASPITTTSGRGLAFTSKNTFSSIKPAQRFSTIVLAKDGKLLATSDITLMNEPYNAVFDNNRLVSNIANFLTGGKRAYHVDDYPYYLGDEFAIVYSEDALLEKALELKNNFGKKATLRKDDPGTGDALILGLYNTSSAKKYLKGTGVSINTKIDVGGTNGLKKEGSFLMALSPTANRNVLLVLSDDKEGVSRAVDSLARIGSKLLTDTVAYSIYSRDKRPPAEEVAKEEEEEAGEPTPEPTPMGNTTYSQGQTSIIVEGGRIYIR